MHVLSTSTSHPNFHCMMRHMKATRHTTMQKIVKNTKKARRKLRVKARTKNSTLPKAHAHASATLSTESVSG